MTSNSKAEGRFSKADFIYIARDDEYQCPAGERLRRHQTSVENGMKIDTYWTYICPHCPLKADCTTGNERRVRRWEHEAVLESCAAAEYVELAFGRRAAGRGAARLTPHKLTAAVAS